MDLLAQKWHPTQQRVSLMIYDVKGVRPGSWHNPGSWLRAKTATQQGVREYMIMACVVTSAFMTGN